MPANRPGIVSPGNLVLEHLHESHRAVEIKCMAEIARLEFLQKRETIRVVFLPAVAPCRPSPAIGSPDEVGFGHRVRHRVAIPGYATDTRAASVRVQGLVHE